LTFLSPGKKEIFMQTASVRLVCSILVLMAPAAVSAATWNINPDHSSIQFQVRYMTVVNVKGSFDKFQGTVQLDEKNPAKSSVNVSIDSTSINTGVEKRDEHLKTDDFFDCPQYPTITFISKKVTPAGKGKLKVIGDLTLLGLTKEVVLEVDGPTPEIKDPWGNIRRGATARTKIDRQDFGMTWNKVLDTGGIMIGNQINVIMEVELMKEPDDKAS
jgi:polyisoprenoid-binding protein YceI